MRTPSISSAFYAPGEPPRDAAGMQMYLRQEFGKVKACLDLLIAGHLDKTYAAPAKPRDGDFRYADGTSWDPGSGEGFYRYDGTTWVFLG